MAIPGNDNDMFSSITPLHDCDAAPGDAEGTVGLVEGQMTGLGTDDGVGGQMTGSGDR